MYSTPTGKKEKEDEAISIENLDERALRVPMPHTPNVQHGENDH
jgi:hypothetical protein